MYVVTHKRREKFSIHEKFALNKLFIKKIERKNKWIFPSYFTQHFYYWMNFQFAFVLITIGGKTAEQKETYGVKCVINY